MNFKPCEWYVVFCTFSMKQTTEATTKSSWLMSVIGHLRKPNTINDVNSIVTDDIVHDVDIAETVFVCIIDGTVDAVSSASVLPVKGSVTETTCRFKNNILKASDTYNISFLEWKSHILVLLS